MSPLISKFHHTRIIISYFTFQRLLNLSGLLISHLLSQHRYFFSKGLSPFFISIEPNNNCQLACPECPVNNDFINSKNVSFFSKSNLENLLDDNRKLMHIIFYFQGEPLINKQLPDLIKLAHQKKIYTSTSTNAQSLTDETAKTLILSGLDKLIVSIDGTTQQVYESYRVGGNLGKAIQGVKYVVDWKKKLGSVTPFIEIQFLVLKTNEHQMSDIKNLTKLLEVDRLCYKSAQLSNFEEGHPLLTSIKKYARYEKSSNGKYVIKNPLKNSCKRLWMGAVVAADGEVLPCCFDKHKKHSFGNLNENSFKEIWHNYNAEKFRKSISENRAQHLICRNCTGK